MERENNRKILCFISVLLIAGCGFLGGCNKPWTATSESPDGKYIATATVFQPGGFGTAGPSNTDVSLKLMSDSHNSMEVLGFSDEIEEATGVNVKMNWITPNHLELTFKGPKSIYFQAVKYFNVDITVRDLSNETTNLPQGIAHP